MAAIELRGVVKRFGPITAVDGLDLDVPEGICLGLLGPNGAGKSTTMRLLTGQAIPDAGELRALGHELPGDAKAARAEMGVVPQLDNLDVDVTVEDNLAVFARLYRVPDVGAAVDRALDLARLRERRRDAVDELSGGMRRRLLLARGLVHEPRADPARRADRRPRPADPHRALDADRRPALARHDDPDVDPLHRGGRAARRRSRGDGQGQDHQPRQAVGADRRARRAARRPRSTRRRNAWPKSAPSPRRSACGCARPGRRSRSSAPSGPTTARVPEDAVVRAASLEDVFVLLTGEEAE